MGILTRILIASGLFLLISCQEYEKLEIIPITNQTSIKTNGFYYYQDNNNKILWIYFLYENGTVYTFYSNNKITTSVKEVEEFVTSVLKIQKPSIYNFGVYNVNNNEIQLEKWLSTAGLKSPTQQLLGIVRNDSTFTISKKIGDDKYTKKDKPTFSVNEIYHFRQFSPKPDSTNKWTK